MRDQLELLLHYQREMGRAAEAASVRRSLAAEDQRQVKRFALRANVCKRRVTQAPAVCATPAT